MKRLIKSILVTVAGLTVFAGIIALMLCFPLYVFPALGFGILAGYVYYFLLDEDGEFIDYSTIRRRKNNDETETHP